MGLLRKILMIHGLYEPRSEKQMNAKERLKELREEIAKLEILEKLEEVGPLVDWDEPYHILQLSDRLYAVADIEANNDITKSCFSNGFSLTVDRDDYWDSVECCVLEKEIPALLKLVTVVNDLIEKKKKRQRDNVTKETISDEVCRFCGVSEYGGASGIGIVGVAEQDDVVVLETTEIDV